VITLVNDPPIENVIVVHEFHLKKSNMMHVYGLTMCISVFHIKFIVIQACQELSDNTSTSEKVFSVVLP